MENLDRDQFSKNAVFAFFVSRHLAENAIETLKSEGFNREEISVLVPSKESSPELAGEPESQIPRGVAAGAAAGAVLGTGIGWLVGLGAFAIPGLGPFIAAGPILGAFAGASTFASIGGLTGAMVGLGLPEHHALKFAGLVKEGRVLLSVHVDDPKQCEKAENILEHTGGHDIFSTLGLATEQQNLVESDIKNQQDKSSVTASNY